MLPKAQESATLEYKINENNDNFVSKCVGAFKSSVLILHSKCDLICFLYQEAGKKEEHSTVCYLISPCIRRQKRETRLHIFFLLCLLDYYGGAAREKRLLCTTVHYNKFCLNHSLCPSSEADAGQVRRASNRVPEIWPGTGHKIADPRRDPGLLRYLEDKVVGEHSGAGRLPHAHVAHDGGCEAEVAPDSREVERGDGRDEALQASLLHAVPHVGGVVLWLDLGGGGGGGGQWVQWNL